ncbi:MAG: nucleoside triphosphate pyrophosphohydrolase [Anaerolineae bacterium]
MTITVVGLGPGDPQKITVEAQRILEEAKEIYLRTRHHPAAEALPEGVTVHSFDYLYEEKETFAEVYQAIAERLLTLVRERNEIIYAVPGHPLVGEASVQLILAGAEEWGIEVKIVPGVSFIEAVSTSLGLDPLDGLQVIDATALAAHHYPGLNPDVPALVGQLYDRTLASDVKLILMNLYPDEHPVTLVRWAGTDREEDITIPLYELDRQDNIDDLTALYIPPLPQPTSMAAFQDLVARLRAPDGCPWDRKQTHRSLRPHLLEEVYEALMALDADNPDRLREELGDLLLQIALHVQIAAEAGEFTLADVIAGISEKIIRRHPHVFAGLAVADPSEVVQHWEGIKREEKGEGAEVASFLEDIPATLPALAQAQDIQERASRVGLWPRGTAVAKERAVQQVVEVVAQAPTAEERERWLGEVLFALVDVVRELGLDAESALRRACLEWRQRLAGENQKPP